MKRFVLLSGWAAAAIAVTSAIALYLQVQGVSGDIDEMHASRTEVALRIGELSQDLETLTSANEELTRRDNEAEEAELRAAEAVEPEVAEERLAPPEPVAAPAEETKPQSVVSMADETVETKARIQVNTEYGEFLVGLRLSGERADEVRAILYEVLGEHIRYLDAQPGERESLGMSPHEYYTDLLRSDLAQVLNAEEMEYFEEYQAEIPTRELRRSYDALLSQFAPGLRPENRAIVLDVLMDEILADHAAQMEQLRRDGLVLPGGGVLIEDLEDPARALSSMENLFRRSVERLADVLDEDQMAVMQRAIEQLENITEMTRQFEQSFEPR